MIHIRFLTLFIHMQDLALYQFPMSSLFKNDFTYLTLLYVFFSIIPFVHLPSKNIEELTQL